jgi:hypothetical protein
MESNSVNIIIMAQVFKGRGVKIVLKKSALTDFVFEFSPPPSSKGLGVVAFDLNQP